MLMDLIALVDLIAATGLYLTILFTVYVDINKVPKQNNLNDACFSWSRPDKVYWKNRIYLSISNNNMPTCLRLD